MAKEIILRDASGDSMWDTVFRLGPTQYPEKIKANLVVSHIEAEWAAPELRRLRDWLTEAIEEMDGDNA